MRKRIDSKDGEIDALIRKSTQLADQVEDEDYSGVEALLEQALAKDPNHQQALRHHAELLWMLGQDLREERKHAEALRCFEKSITSWRRLIRLNEEFDPDVFYEAACCAANTGAVKRAVKYLAEAFAHGFKDHPKRSKGLDRCEKDKDLGAIRDDQDYQKLIRQLKTELQKTKDTQQPKPKRKSKQKPRHKLKSSQPIRRFVHPDGRWINIATVEGNIVQFSGAKESTVPFFCGVEEKNFAPRAGRSAVEEMENLAVDFKRRKYGEITPTKRPAGETKINGLWQRLENWLCEYAPVFCRWPLAPGASKRDLQAFERAIGAKLPADVRESYLRHNGSAGVSLLAIVGEGKWVTLNEAIHHWKLFQDIKPELEAAGSLETPKGPMKKVHISAGWIPISDDSGGDHLCVDLDPAEDGKVGQLFSYWHEYGAWRIVAPSFTVFLERLVKHLVRGRYAVNNKGQLAPLNGPAPEKVDKVLDHFLED